VLGYAPAASRALQGALDLYRAIGATGPPSGSRGELVRELRQVTATR